VAEQVVTRSSGAVMLVGPHCADDWTPEGSRVVLCHDGSHIPDGLVELASDWAEALGQTVSVVTVVHPLDVESAERPEQVFAGIAGELAERGHAPDTELVRSRYAAGALADAAASAPTALLVMASHTRHGLPRVVIGSTTTGTVALAPCPVLVLPLVPDPSHA
jgi:nucleotide-binding universal stress UspA family protein